MRKRSLRFAIVAFWLSASTGACGTESEFNSQEGTRMEKLDRIVPLPAAMQGRWLDSDDASTELVIAGGEVTYSGDTVDYEYKVITEEEGALTVTLGIENEALEDAFQRENVTGLVITPEGEFHAYNVKFASQFERVPERD